MNLKFILLLGLLGVLNAHDVLGPKTAVFVKKCNLQLVKGYGFRGEKKPIPRTLPMCPKIKKSCCKVADQLTIYANWIHSKEKLSVQSRFGILTKVFDKLICLVEKVAKLAKKIVKKLEGKLLSNCKLLAKKILLFEIEATKTEIVRSFRKMEKFFVRSYGGFYCAICDHKNHLLFDMDDSAVFYSINFCRETVEHALIPVLYMNIHFKHMMTVVTRFVTSCDFKGTFTRDVPIKPIHVFPVNEKIAKSLLECRNNRNKPAWFVECEPLCREVKLTKFSQILAPTVGRMVKYNKFLDGELKRINNEARLKVISGAGGTKKLKKKKKKKATKRLRMLSSNPGNKKKTKKKKGKRKPEKPIFFTSKGGVITSKTKIDFIKGGLNLADTGKCSVINKAIFNQIKMSIGMKRLGKVKAMAYGLVTKKSGLFGSAGVFQGVMMLVMSWATLVYLR